MAANDIIRYFDLQSAKRTIKPVGHGGAGGVSAPIWPQYVALVLGIVVQPYLQHYMQTSQWSLTVSDVIGRLAFGLIIGALAFPAVYKNAFDADKPLVVQLCAIFAAGIGWQSLIEGGAKAALGTG
jgi:hypothetical protein